MDVQSLTHDLNKFDGGYKILQARPSEIIKDLKISKQLIEALVENKVYALAYPYGIYNDAIITYAREAGFKMAFTIKGDSIKRNSDIMALKRSNIYNWMSLSQFIKTWKMLKNNLQGKGDPVRNFCEVKMRISDPEIKVSRK